MFRIVVTRYNGGKGLLEPQNYNADTWDQATEIRNRMQGKINVRTVRIYVQVYDWHQMGGELTKNGG